MFKPFCSILLAALIATAAAGLVAPSAKAEDGTPISLVVTVYSVELGKSQTKPYDLIRSVVGEGATWASTDDARPRPTAYSTDRTFRDVDSAVERAAMPFRKSSGIVTDTDSRLASIWFEAGDDFVRFDAEGAQPVLLDTDGGNSIYAGARIAARSMEMPEGALSLTVNTSVRDLVGPNSGRRRLVADGRVSLFPEIEETGMTAAGVVGQGKVMTVAKYIKEREGERIVFTVARRAP